MVVVPLVFASVVRGLTACDDMQQLRTMGVRALVFFVLTTAGAAMLGIALASFLRPGRYIQLSNPDPVAAVEGAKGSAPETLPSLEAVPGVITNLLPANPLAAMVGGQML
jgi:Na+/H+-dicarboxylate symporter